MKKLIATLASLALLAGACAMPAAAEETYSLGDVTMDGKVDTLDVIAALEAYVLSIITEGRNNGLTEEQNVLGDVWKADNSLDIGPVTAGDAELIAQYYSHLLCNPTDTMEEFLKKEGWLS